MRLPTRNSPMWRWIFLLACAACLSGLYLVNSARTYSLGFPLDDAWIHQTYARNLGQAGQWAFIAGQPSAGSTSPLWSALLAIGFALRQANPFPWTFGLGILSLWGMAVCAEQFARGALRQEGISLKWMPWFGLFILSEYHLVWASVSGMETDLMGLLYLAGLGLMLPGKRARWGWVGSLVGLACWIRPDGLTLLGPALWVIGLSYGSWRERISKGLSLAAGFLPLFAAYMGFNRLIQGTFWPNTFYAKQAEYAVLQNQPFIMRYWGEFSLVLIGAGLFLLPGFIFIIWRAVQLKNWAGLAAVLWFLGYAGMYAWKLPVTYQYGRYLMPAMPVYFVLGLTGMALLLERIRSKPARLGGFAWRLVTAGVLLGFYWIGANRYAQDVAIIQTEMVTAAEWVAVNVPPQALVAAHDIGAMGYYGNHPLVDLAGLVTPEVIPFIRDEKQLAAYLDRRDVAVLVTFSDWYQELPQSHEILYNANGAFTRGGHMTVYRWK